MNKIFGTTSIGDAAAVAAIDKARMATPSKAWQVVALLFFVQVVNYFDKQVLSFASVPMMAELGITPTEYGLLAGSFFILFTPSAMLAGMVVIKRVGPKTLISLLMCIWCLSQLPLIFASTFGFLLFGRILLGFGEGPAGGAALNSCYTWFPDERRSLPNAVVLLGSMIGSAIAGPILSYTIESYGWRSGFATAAILGVICLVLWVAFAADGPFGAGPAKAEQPQPESVKTAALNRIPQRFVWTDPTVACVLFMGVVGFWVIGISMSWTVPFLRNGLSFSAIDAGWLAAAIHGVYAALLLLTSIITDFMLKRGVSFRFARGIFPSVLTAVAGASFALMLVTDESRSAQVLLLITGISAAGASNCLLAPLLAGVVPPVHTGSALLYYTAIGAIGGLLSPPIFGWLLSGSLPGTPEAYHAPFAVTAALLLTSGLLGFLLLRPERTKQRFENLAGRIPTPAGR